MSVTKCQNRLTKGCCDLFLQFARRFSLPLQYGICMYFPDSRTWRILALPEGNLLFNRLSSVLESQIVIVYYVPRRIIRVITRRATMHAGLIVPRHRLGFFSASISCEHCRSLRNNPHCAPRHVIYYSLLNLVHEIIFPLKIPTDLHMTSCGQLI